MALCNGWRQLQASPAAQHYLVYIKRRLGTGRGASGPAAAPVQAALEGPAGHGFGQGWLYQRLKSGKPSCLWLFSTLRYGDWSLPPALDACITVKRAYSRTGQEEQGVLPPAVARLLNDFPFACSADPAGSFYLPWNNAAALLDASFPRHGWAAIPAEPCHRRLLRGILPRYQSPRILDRSAAGAFTAHADALARRPRAFLSYRRAEAALPAMLSAALLAAHGFAPWWDQWAMPRKVAEEKALLDNALLDEALDRVIKESELAVTLHSRHYASTRSPWTSRELELIENRAGAGGLGHLRLFSEVLQPEELPTLKSILESALRRAGQWRAGGEVVLLPTV